jgi:His-Xaa-Ser system radical SAM maturase HxsC
MIPLKCRGKAWNVKEPIVGRINTSLIVNDDKQSIYVLDDDSDNLPDAYTPFITTKDLLVIPEGLLGVTGVASLNHLKEGDIVSVEPDGYIRTLYRIDANQNTLLTTERCNSNCIMCSQPPRDRDDVDYIAKIHRSLIPLIPKSCPELGISGGEPTLLGRHFFELLHLIGNELPDTSIHILSNGRTFAWDHWAEALSKVGVRDMVLGIPLYSDYYQIHDYIVQSRDAFHQTMQGLYNLMRWGVRIEIRIVLHKQTYPRLDRLARFIYKNLPFVEHVAFMGLEYVGYTPHNRDLLWVDPTAYGSVLEDATSYLSGNGMGVSIYNLPYCLLPKSTWEYARQSISDWKTAYHSKCSGCSMLDSCAGMFSWNVGSMVELIHPIHNT